jgi:presenilin-like A22 family membrane protease
MEEPGVIIEHPNRDKAASKLTRAMVVVLLLVSAGLVTIITVGGWDALEGAKPLQVAYIVLYVMLVFFVLRWSRGVLPVIAALAIVLLIFAAVSTPAWFDRDKAGFTNPALDADLLGLLTALLVPAQILLIAFAMSGFRQAWNVEVERQEDGPPPDRSERRGPAPAAA